MAFRSHLSRPMDPASYWNRAVLILIPVFGVGGVVGGLTRDGSVWPGIEAAGTVFLIWALARELDPDGQATALIAGLGGGIWALFGLGVELLPLVGFMVMARILAETTGRRPLPSDLIAVSLGASLISFTPLGFATGFGIAVAIWVDERKAEEHHPRLIWFSPLAAAGATVVASLTRAFPEELPTIEPQFVIALVALAIITVLREPPQPISLVDSRKATFLRQDRIHAARIAVALVAVLGALISDTGSVALVPVGFTLALALGSSELERRTRGPL